MAYRSVLLLSISLAIICMSIMVNCSLLDNVVDPKIISDTTGIESVTIFGTAQCPFPPLARPNEASLPEGINVALTCDGGRTLISNALTDTTGFFKITLNTLQSSIFHPNQCSDCRIAVSSNFAGCGVFPGRRGSLLAPINCRDVVVQQLRGDEQGHSNAVYYKAEPFYFDPLY
ncbi:hypothetical protein L484_008629 [Morus notabilis]|uniref:Uncharacterized protein n=1 Tax=Morus notabilis TaxID=981085 RepID=W9RU94_9ROSA|nr:hypothetical protein L484_008629 [Morus notabilis]